MSNPESHHQSPDEAAAPQVAQYDETFEYGLVPEGVVQRLREKARVFSSGEDNPEMREIIEKCAFDYRFEKMAWGRFAAAVIERSREKTEDASRSDGGDTAASSIDEAATREHGNNSFKVLKGSVKPIELHPSEKDAEVIVITREAGTPPSTHRPGSNEAT